MLVELADMRILAVTAHPDDIENSAGTVAKWTARGASVEYLIVTAGDQGGFGSVDRHDIPQVRQQEQRAAAAAVGVTEVTFLSGYRDGHVEVTDSLIKDITRAIRRVRPHRVISLSPERTWTTIKQTHSDHLNTGEATARAVYPTCRNPYAFPELHDEGLPAWTVSNMWIQGHPRPNHAEDVTATIDQKVAALLSHASQLPDPDAAEHHIRATAAAAAADFGLPSNHYAETFLRVRTDT